MKQDFPDKSFSLPTLFTVKDIILLFISYSISLARYGTAFVLLAFRLKNKENYRILTD